jgi:hypothetical protein
MSSRIARSSLRSSAALAATAVVFLLGGSPAEAQRGDDSKRASKNGKVTGTVDGVAVTVEYGRPKVKGRTVWGQLVPYGQVWRTGADEATTITFSADVMVEGKRLPAGTYALFSIPTESGWTWIFNSQAKQWGAFSYKDSADVLRVTAKPAPADPVEEMDFRIEGDTIVLRWEKLAVPMKIQKA